MTSLADVVDVFARQMDAKSAAPVVVGFSGGGDSTALLLCARQWARQANRPLLALTVDHGLQADSSGWTAAAGETARRLGASWRPLVWRGCKPSTGLPAAARAARHALLADATREAGACVLLLGHTADDVAESDLIRCDTPHHGRLQDWSPSPAWPQGRSVFLLRPLLGLGRAELRRWLSAHGIGWLEDPANEDLRFGRTRARRQLQASPRSPSAGGMASWRQVTSREPILRLTEAWSGIELEGAALLEACDAADLLGRVVLCASGGARPAARASVENILARLAGEAAPKMVLAGAHIEVVGSKVRVSREIGRQPPVSLQLTGDEPQVFDGRFELTGADPGWTAQPLNGSAAQLYKRERERLRVVPAHLRPSLPLLRDPEGGAHLPAPLGAGPARLRSLVGARLEAALGLIVDEVGAARQISAGEDHSGDREAVLSCPAETKVLRQAAAARRPAMMSRRIGPEGRP